jgi:hypothetical protein
VCRWTVSSDWHDQVYIILYTNTSLFRVTYFHRCFRRDHSLNCIIDLKTVSSLQLWFFLRHFITIRSKFVLSRCMRALYLSCLGFWCDGNLVFYLLCFCDKRECILTQAPFILDGKCNNYCNHYTCMMFIIIWLEFHLFFFFLLFHLCLHIFEVVCCTLERLEM